ncbi:hypothetical protein FOZ63_028762 [Perkinsus olseni]|uniref:Uncharacterized protein n=1 Tax=Perkinsus olseni TaxID=32597 RepID=A0A7J6QJT7_PEROL|nr:hypothetical protein FOZ63_028762 [Perkinsus olseni]
MNTVMSLLLCRSWFRVAVSRERRSWAPPASHGSGSGQVHLKPYTPVVSSEGPASMPTVQIGFGGPWPFYAKDGDKLYGQGGPWQAQNPDPHTVHATNAAAMIKEMQRMTKATAEATRASGAHLEPLYQVPEPGKCVPWHLNLDMLRLRQAIERAEEIERVLSHDFHIVPFDAGLLPRLDLEAVSAHPARFDDVHGHVPPAELQGIRHLRDHVEKLWTELRSDKTLEGLDKRADDAIMRPFTEMKLAADSLYMHARKCLFPPHRLPDAFIFTMTSFVDRLFLSPEELAIATEISAITNPTTTPIPRSITIRAAESLQRIVDPRLQSYAVKLLTEPFLKDQDSWRGVVGVCAVFLHLANTDSHLSWLDTILKLCREIGDHFEHEDARVRSLVRMEALSVVRGWGSGTANTHARPATVEGEGSSVSIPTWDELSAEEDPSFDKVQLDMPSSPASTASAPESIDSSQGIMKSSPPRSRRRAGLLWHWWSGDDWRELPTRGSSDVDL